MTAIKNGTLLVKDSNGNTARVATLSQTDITTLNTALTDIEANKKKINSISANYVTTNTAQTITGAKIFTAKIRAIQYEIEPPPGDTNGGAIDFHFGGSTNDFTSRIIEVADGQLRLVAKNGIVIDDVPINENSNKVPTTKWVNDKVNPIKNNYVTTNTAQNITAIKTIALPSNRHAIIVKDTGSDNTVTPASTQWQSMTIAVDKNGKERACCQATLDTGGYSRTKLMAIQQDSNGNNIYNNLELAIKPDGTRQAYLSSSPASNSNDTSIATTEWVNFKISTGGGSIPVGTIILSAGAIPLGYLLCNGATVSRTKYAKLFKVIGTSWGAGDGSTTFKLPDARGRFPEGANGNFGAYHEAGLPNITGTAKWSFMGITEDGGEYSAQFSGAITNTSRSPFHQSYTTGAWGSSSSGIAFNAASSSSIYKANSTVQPNSFCIQYLIKY